VNITDRHGYRHNPVLQRTIEEVSSCLQVHGSVGRGRCFIRAALNTKIISVPVEQLVKNHKLTNVRCSSSWYSNMMLCATT